jgi:IS5 family transposase
MEAGQTNKQENQEASMIRLRHQQLTLWGGYFAAEVADLWEPWMREVDTVLEDEELVAGVWEAQAQRHRQSRTRGRPQTPAEVVLRLLILKHVRNWSYDTLEREVRANLVYRTFTRIGTEKVPDAKTLARLAQAIGPDIVQRIHQRLIELAQQKKIVRGRTLRVDTTVVEANIHYPTDSSLLGDGVRVLTRTMQKIAAISGDAGTRLRNRTRSVGHRLREIGRAARSKNQPKKERLEPPYRRLLTATRKVVNQAKRFVQEVADGVKQSADPMEQAKLEGLRQDLEEMIPRVRQVIRQTKARIVEGTARSTEKLVSVFEPTTEIIRKGKASKPTEFGKMVQVQEAENQIITHYEVYEERPSDSDLLVPAVEEHERQLGRVPRLVAADAGYYSQSNEQAVTEMGVKYVSVPNLSTKSEQRRQHQKKRWFRKGQKWRSGSEGRISLLKRRHGLNRCRYRGFEGMQRWVGLGVIADTLINMGRVMVAETS